MEWTRSTSPRPGPWRPGRCGCGAEPAGAESFGRQLAVAAERLVDLPAGADAVAERGPLDFLAYLGALADLGRPSVRRDVVARLRATTAEAMAHVDLLVVLPLEVPDLIHVPDDEDPELREAMDAHLLDLIADPGLVPGATRVLEVTGAPEQRLSACLRAVGASLPK
ncbi:MAG TPA: hypothetical protein VF143_04390 [Candidatus Nanopelagicales bacterium]